MRRTILTAILIPLALATGLRANDRPTQEALQTQDDFVSKYGFVEFEQSLATDGREVILMHPTGPMRDDVELAVFRDRRGGIDNVILMVARSRVASDTEDVYALMGDFLTDMASYDDRPAAGRMAYLIGSDDPAVRRGEGPTSSGCCALPPEPKENVAAMEVVDQLREAATLEWEDVDVVFRNNPMRDGRPALTIQFRSR